MNMGTTHSEPAPQAVRIITTQPPPASGLSWIVVQEACELLCRSLGLEVPVEVLVSEGSERGGHVGSDGKVKLIVVRHGDPSDILVVLAHQLGFLVSRLHPRLRFLKGKTLSDWGVRVNAHLWARDAERVHGYRVAAELLNRNLISESIYNRVESHLYCGFEVYKSMAVGFVREIGEDQRSPNPDIDLLMCSSPARLASTLLSLGNEMRNRLVGAQLAMMDSDTRPGNVFELSAQLWARSVRRVRKAVRRTCVKDGVPIPTPGTLAWHSGRRRFGAVRVTTQGRANALYTPEVVPVLEYSRRDGAVRRSHCWIQSLDPITEGVVALTRNHPPKIWIGSLVSVPFPFPCDDGNGWAWNPVHGIVTSVHGDDTVYVRFGKEKTRPVPVPRCCIYG